MPTVEEIRKILADFSEAKVTKAIDLSGRVHVEGFVASLDLKRLVERYNVLLHSDGVLCVG